VPPTNSEALETILAGVEAKAPALAALARTLAAKLDNDAGLATAAVAREYRAVLDALARAGDRASDPFEDLFAEMGDPT
jgi:hypothetical protein